MNPRMLVLLTLLICAPQQLVPAQVAPGYWSSWESGPGCGVCAWSRTGAQVAAFPFTNFGPIVAKHPANVIYVGDGSQGLITPFTVLGVAGPPISVPQFRGMEIDVTGDIWTWGWGALAPWGVRKHNTQGQLQFAVLNSTPTIFDAKADGFGNLWISNSFEVRRIDGNGNVSAPLAAVPAGHSIHAIEVDRAGRLWAIISDPFSAWLVRVETSGSINVWTALGSTPIALDVDVCGRPHVAQITGAQEIITIHDPDTGAVVKNVVITPGGLLGGMAVDVTGHYWMTDSSGTALILVEPTGSVVQVFTNLGARVNHPGMGDPTGLQLASLLDPVGDADNDGFSNKLEIETGSDPFDPAYLPPALTLTGTPAAGQTLALSMVIPQDVFATYLIGASLSHTGGISLLPGSCRTVQLDSDPFLQFWFGPTNAFASGTVGILDVTGSGTASMTVPAGVPVSGVTLFFAGLTVNPFTGEARSATRALPVTFQ